MKNTTTNIGNMAFQILVGNKMIKIAKINNILQNYKQIIKTFKVVSLKFI